jgi:hypothetical protein
MALGVCQCQPCCNNNSQQTAVNISSSTKLWVNEQEWTHAEKGGDINRALPLASAAASVHGLITSSLIVDTSERVFRTRGLPVNRDLQGRVGKYTRARDCPEGEEEQLRPLHRGSRESICSGALTAQSQGDG